MATTPTTLGSGGAWTWFHEPRAVRYVGTNDKTYFSYAHPTDGIQVGAIDNATGTLDTPYDIASSGVDDHDNATVWVRPSDGRVVFAQVNHGSTSGLRIGISGAAESIASFTVNTLSTPSATTYPTLVHLTGEGGTNGRVYMFYRAGASNFHSYRYSDDLADSGVTAPTWSDPVEFLSTTATNLKGPYLKFGSNGDDAVAIATSRAVDATVSHNDIRFAIFRAEALYDIDNTTLLGSDAASSFPVVFEDIPEVIHETATDGRYSWINDCSWNGGNFEVVYTAYWTGGAMWATYARWNGTSWDKSEMQRVARITPYSAPENVYNPGICLDHSQGGTVWLSIGDDVSSQIWRWVTADNGSSWTKTRISSLDDGEENIRPMVPRNISTPADGAHASYPCLWMRGAYQHYDSTNGGYQTSLVSAAVDALDQPTFPADWTRRCKITIPSTNFDSDLTDFVLFLDESALPSEIFTEAQSDGGDIRFATGGDGATELASYMTLWDATGSKAGFFVKLPSASSTADNELWVFYGSTGRVRPGTFEDNGAAEALSDYIAFYHFNEASGVAFNFIRGHEANLTSGTVSYQQAGKVGYAYDKTSATAIGTTGQLFVGGEWNTSQKFAQGCWMTTAGLNVFAMRTTSCEFLIGGASTSGNFNVRTSASDSTAMTALPTTGENHLVAVIESGATSLAFVNGTQRNSWSQTAITALTSFSLLIQDTAQENMSLAWVRRGGYTADYIAAEYANQNDPASFATVGTAENADGSTDPNAISGAAASTSAATGALTGTGAITGAADHASAAAGTLTGVGALTGTAATTSAASGTLNGSSAFSGAAAGTSAATGTLTGVGALTATAADTSSASGTLTDAATLSGTAATISAATATLSALGALIGNSEIVTSAAGNLTDAAAVVTARPGTATLSISGPTATLSIRP